MRLSRAGAAALFTLIVLLGAGAPRAQAPAAAAPDRSDWLVDVTRAAGLEFTHETGARGSLWMPEVMSGGVALFDCDGDEDLDLYLTSGGFSLDDGTTAAAARNRLFRQGKNGRFSDVTERSGAGDDGYGMGVAVGDVDNDGDLDLYVTNFGADRLYLNRGDCRFEDGSSRLGNRAAGWSASATFLDYDRDGWLDLYVTQYVVWDRKKRCTDAAGRPDYCSPRMFPPAADILLRNDGSGRFVDRTSAAGISAAIGAGLGVVSLDLTSDGWPDIYVANDGDANQLWVNRRDGTFRDQGLLLGAAYNLDGEAEAGMGVVAEDFDADQDFDLFLTHLSDESNTLYRSQGGSRGYEDASGASGMAMASLPHTGFGVVAVDLELDGDLDLVIGNGRVSGGTAAAGADSPWSRLAEPNQVFLNDGSGRFEADPFHFKPFTDPHGVSRGLACGDVDGDGDFDLLLVDAQARARLFRNEAPRRGSWLGVRAVDPQTRRDAYGAVVTLVGKKRSWLRRIGPGSSYLSSNDPRAHFGLGDLSRLERIEILWPDGRRENFPAPELNRWITLLRGRGKTP